MSAHKTEYQHPVILDNIKKNKERKHWQGNSRGTTLKKRELSFLSCLKSVKIRSSKAHIIFASYAIEIFIKNWEQFKTNENNLVKYFVTNVLKCYYSKK